MSNSASLTSVSSVFKKSSGVIALDERPPLECMLESLDRILSLAMDFPNDGKIVLCFICLNL